MVESIHVRRFGSGEELETATALLIRKELQYASKTPRLLLLSGGNTPLSVFDAVRRKPFTIDANARVAYTDERHVPEDAPESNFGASLPMLRALQVSESQVLRVHTDLSLKQAARNYSRQFQEFFDQNGEIGTALLGLGTDGHTCSLFTQEDLTHAHGSFAAPVFRPVPPHRVTVTPALLARANRIIFLVRGVEKTPIVSRFLQDPWSLIAGKAVAGCRQVALWQA